MNTTQLCLVKITSGSSKGAELLKTFEGDHETGTYDLTGSYRIIGNHTYSVITTLREDDSDVIDDILYALREGYLEIRDAALVRTY